VRKIFIHLIGAMLALPAHAGLVLRSHRFYEKGRDYFDQALVFDPKVPITPLDIALWLLVILMMFAVGYCVFRIVKQILLRYRRRRFSLAPWIKQSLKVSAILLIVTFSYWLFSMGPHKPDLQAREIIRKAIADAGPASPQISAEKFKDDQSESWRPQTFDDYTTKPTPRAERVNR
jgi:hypothetical protein